MPNCSWDSEVSKCAVTDWTACGYHWLHVAPIGSYWCVWIGLGLYVLHHNGSLRGFFRVNPAEMHDYVAQGIAIALRQRKDGSLQRSLRLGAMWAEWPAFTLVPLQIAFTITGEPSIFRSLGPIFSFSHEETQFDMRHHILHRIVHPVAFDLLYIPLVSTFLRLGTCPIALEHVELPGGITCDCINRFGLFWFVGIVCFALYYCRTLYHKMMIEPLATIMDFRFQPSYQYIIVMARTLCPIVAILVMNVGPGRYQVVCILCGLLIVWCWLLVYSYLTQPCIGSGRVPNNIRALTFSSATYSTLCSIGILLGNGSLYTFSLFLIPLPLVWATAWRLNNRRAMRYHIPYASILELLVHPSPPITVVGAVAATYMNPLRVVGRDHEQIIMQLWRVAEAPSYPMGRVYALRTLWFCYIESFLADHSEAVGDTMHAVPFRLWLKDCANSDRPPPARVAHKKATKLRCTDIADEPIPPLAASSLLELRSIKNQGRARRFKRSGKSSNGNTGRSSTHDTGDYHVITVAKGNWISHILEPTDARQRVADLSRLVLDVWVQSCALYDHQAMHECALFLLQWYRTGYLHLQPLVFLQVLTVLCMAGLPKQVMDATHTLYNATLDKVLPMALWLECPACVNHFAYALDVKSKTTVTKCASILVLVVDAAQAKTKLNVLLTTGTVVRIEAALAKWSHVYRISDSLERIYLSLNELRPDATVKGSSFSRVTPVVERCKSNSVSAHPLEGGANSDATTSHWVCQRRHTLRPVASKWTIVAPRRHTHPRGSVSPTLDASLNSHSFLRLCLHVPVERNTTVSTIKLEVLRAAEQRRSRRLQFIEILQRAYALAQDIKDMTNSPGVHDAITSAVKLYAAPDECAIHDYMESRLDPAVQEFFEDILASQPRLEPAVIRRRSWLLHWR
ncbi:hypothetical protein ACHHYP_09222 [Achlya hypogyna]|uniref:Transmembrane protein n=1 Tax=Achlya hypogyna TaxID=1202772 RepID=A0A1V9YNK2_ACHHY|nr:hypothetical protein ACHHYP_09222 [Achlya hypogyna]